MQMIAVPAGHTFVGTSQEQVDALVAQTTWAAEWAEKGYFAREQPQHEAAVADFSMGIHPVTVGQYQAFIDAGGYTTERFWTADGRLWLEKYKNTAPAFWHDKRWTADKRLPVVGVSWYEAVAYCHWLGEVMGLNCRLPTEVEWEKAAGGEDARLYPWGDQYDAQKCNIRASGLGYTIPVGSYSPDGDSPYSCQDMVGNVSEWVLSKFMSYPYDPQDGRDDLRGTAERVIRGGSWHSPDFRARIAARGMNDPAFQDNDLGFRIVAQVKGDAWSRRFPRSAEGSL